MSRAPFDISKLVVAKLHSTKARKTYNCLIFSTNSKNVYYENYFLKENCFLDINENIVTSSTYFQQITWAYDF
jgi:hypothetical protein